MKLNVKLLLILILLPLVLLIGAGYLSFVNQRDMLQAEKEQQTLLYTEKLALNLSSIMQRQKQILEDFSRLPFVLDMMKKMPDSNVKADYEEMPEYEPYLKVAKAFAADEKVGLMYMGAPQSLNALANVWIDLPPGYDGRERPWYSAAEESGEFSITEPYIDQASDEGNIVVSASLPVREQGELIGVSAIDMTLDSLLSYLQEETGSSVGGIYLIDNKSGSLIFGQDQEPLSMSFSELLESSEVQHAEELLNTVNQQSSGITSVRASGDNPFKNSIIGYNEVALTPWVVSVAYPKSELQKQVIGPVLRTTITSTLIILGVLLLAYLIISRTIVRSITLTTRNLQEISQGARDLTVRMDVKTKDEIGILSISFNSFVDRLREIISSVKADMQSINQRQNDLAANAEETASASTQISSNVQNINKEIEHLDNEVQDESSAIEELRRTVENLRNNVESQSSAITQSTASIEEMMASLQSVAQTIENKQNASQSLSKTIEEGSKTVEESSRAIEEVVQQAGRITEISEVITNVAGQTNLLSMNAAIEAAHAGESGKGFAVVADEIRKLAEASQNNSKEISTTIKEILQSLETASKASHTNLETFDVIRRETHETVDAFNEINSNTQELSQGSQQILEAITNLNHIASEVKSGSDEMRESVEVVHHATDRVTQISATVKSGIHEISSGTNEIAESMNYVENIIQDITDKVNKISKEVEQFKTETTEEETIDQLDDIE
ncbi:MAG: methyl-accepting chemotaxis protein [Spirochaetia bacterium]